MIKMAKRGKGYKFLDNITSADVAFEGRGESLDSLFENCAYALENVMINRLDKVSVDKVKKITVKAGDIDQLLLLFLHEVITLKDIERMVFSEFKVRISRDGDKGYMLRCVCKGSKIDPKLHDTVVDVKGISMHRLKVEGREGAYRAMVVVDV